MNASGRFLKLILLLFIITPFNKLSAQEEISEKVKNEFRAISLINIKTTRTVPQHSFELNIQHRFGKADIHKDFLKNFFGMDLSSDIRFGFSFPLKSNLYVGIGRTKYTRLLDLDTKYTLLQQTEDNRIPVFVAFYLNVSARTFDAPNITPNMYINDTLTPFVYKNSYRFCYFYQIILSRKFNNAFSALSAPAILHRNLVYNNQPNDIYILPFGGRIKIGFQSSLLFEYTIVFNKPAKVANPYAVGFEIGSAGHVFQITLSSINRISEPYLFVSTGVNPLKGQFFIGFNIHRTFFLKKQ